jgi:hypothetical protein
MTNTGLKFANSKMVQTSPCGSSKKKMIRFGRSLQIKQIDSSVSTSISGSGSSALTDSSSQTSVDESLDFQSSQCRKGCMRIKTHEDSLSRSWSKALSQKTQSNIPTVRFGTVSINYHFIRLGDHPSVSVGPPLCIEWEAFDSFTINLEKYENSKTNSRDFMEMLIPVRVRELMLTDVGFSRMEMATASRNAELIRLRRRIAAKDDLLKKGGITQFLKRLRGPGSIIQLRNQGF